MIPGDKAEEVFILTKNIDGKMNSLKNCFKDKAGGSLYCCFRRLTQKLINLEFPLGLDFLKQLGSVIFNRCY